jgi:hypothetical protein
MSFPSSSSSSSSSSMAAAFACERRRLRRHQSGFDNVGCRLRRRVSSSSSSSSSSSAREERSAKSDDDDDTRAKHLLLRRLREQLQQQKQHKQRENDDKEDDDVRFVCVALLSDDEGAFFSSSTTTTTTMDSLDDDAPGTFAVLLSSPLRFCSSEKEEEEEEARRLCCWTRVELKSTKRLKEDAISSLRRAVSTERRTRNDAKEKEEENRLVAVAYKPLAIGARKKAFRDAEKYFEETFSVSFSSSSSTTSEEKVENGGDSGDVSSSRSSSSSSSSSSTRGLFSSEDVKQLETYGFVVLDGVVPEQAVRQMYEHAESLADKLFPVDQDGRDDDLASIKIDIDNPAASPLNLAGTFLWSLPRKLCEAASASSSPPPNCALAARARAENTALDKFAQLAKYDKRGARYDPHVDYDPNNSDGPEGSRISERNLTAILYFNVGYANEAEGCLRVFLDDREEENRAPVAAAAAAAAVAVTPPPPQQQHQQQKYVDVQPLPGRLVVFDSRRILHGVMPSYRRRWAITVWS